jgi:hypothetical protein
MVAEKVLSEMSPLIDELIEQKFFDDDDEERDESRLDDLNKGHEKFLDEAIADGLARHPDINRINNLPPCSDPDIAHIAQDAEQLKDLLTKCPIGATEFKVKFLRPLLKRMVRSAIKNRFDKDPKYIEHVRGDVPGTNIKAYGEWSRTSSKGTFVKVDDYEGGGGLETLLTGGWLRVCKDRIDHEARSYQFGLPRKTNRQSWRHHYRITERNGKESPFALEREKLAGTGASARWLQQLRKNGVHIVERDVVRKHLLRFLHYKPLREIVRMPQVGFFEVNGHYICVRSNETLLPPVLRELKDVVYVADNAGDPDQYGHQIKGTTTDWQRAVAIPLRGNSNIALALSTSTSIP